MSYHLNLILQLLLQTLINKQSFSTNQKYFFQCITFFNDGSQHRITSKASAMRSSM